MEDLIWKDVIGYGSLYMFNGHIYKKRENPKLLKKSKTTTGYYKIELVKDGFKKSMKVHRLVAYAFLESDESRIEVNHKDLDPLNNKVENLEWCTRKENVQHAIENYASTILKRNDVEIVCNLYKIGFSSGNIAEIFSVDVPLVLRFLRRHGVKIRSSSEASDKYKIDRVKMVKLFEEGIQTRDIVKSLGGNTALISTYKNKWKKGELKI